MNLTKIISGKRKKIIKKSNKIKKDIKNKIIKIKAQVK